MGYLILLGLLLMFTPNILMRQDGYDEDDWVSWLISKPLEFQLRLVTSQRTGIQFIFLGATLATLGF